MKKVIVVLFFGIITMGTAEAQSTVTKSRKQYNIDKQNVAIQGYDPVSYFIDETPTKGEIKFAYNYNGVQYHFSSTNNRKKFVADPKKYEPAYGGWCAYAMGLKGEKVKIDPMTYKIVEGKLNLFYNFGFTNTLKSWNKN